MSYRSPSSQQLASFSPSSKSFKRRSLQSPFILNDLSGDAEQLETGKQEEPDFSDYEDNNSNDNIINETFNSDSQSVQSQTENTTRVTNTNYYHHSGFVQPAFPDLDKMYTSSIHSNDNLTANSLSQFSESSSSKLNNKNKRYSLQMPSVNISSSSSSSSHKYHKRSTSTASVNYTPAPLNIPPIKLNANTPPMTSIETLSGNSFNTTNSNNNSPIVKPFQFNSMMMSNNSSENLSLQSANNNGTTKQPQILPKASYRRGHRYKHSSVSMNMFQDPQRIASMNKPHNLPKKYEIPSFKQIISLISLSQKKKLFVCFIQISVTLISYVLGYNYNNSCLLTLSHILFYDVISNLSLVMVQIMSNFEVWRLSSLKFPFGLGRIEVLFGFALSVSLLFVGLDLFSHILEEFLIVSFVNDGNFGNDDGSLHNHGKNNDNVNFAKNLNPILYEIFIILIILITVSTSHIVNSKNNNKEDEIIDKINTNINNNNISNAKRLNSITLKEPIRENLVTELGKYIKFKLGIKSNLFHGSTTGLSLLYSIYSLYYPFAQGLLKLHSIHDESLQLEGHDHVEDANKMTEWINHGSTIFIAILISVIAWKLIWRLGNILLLSSPSIDMKFEDIEEMIESNIREIDVYKSSYNITEIKVARLNTKMYVVIVCVNMPGASDDDEAKFRFYTMRIVRGVMLQTVNGQLSTRERNSAEDKRRSLIDLLNLSTSIEDAEGTESENFEITVDINRL